MGHRWCLGASLLASTILVLIAALELSIVELVTPFLMAPIFAAACLILVACFSWALVNLVRNREQMGLRAGYPAIACAVGAAIAVFVPWSDLWLKANYSLLRSSRSRIVRQVQEGARRPNVERYSTLISLGLDAPQVSMGGNEIVVERLDGEEPYIFFFTYRGILDNFHGFLFVPTGGDPLLFSYLDEPGSTHIKPMEEHWYFVAHR